LQALYRAVLAPVEALLPAETVRLILSPDSQLNFVSFATLLDDHQQFLAEKYAVQYVVSGRDLLRAARPFGPDPRIVLFANPEFYLSKERDRGGLPPVRPSPGMAENPGKEGVQASRAQPPGTVPANARRELDDWIFTPLPGTQQESERLASCFGGWHWQVAAYCCAQATKQALRQNVHSPFILHLATHGFFDPQGVPGNAPATIGSNGSGLTPAGPATAAPLTTGEGPCRPPTRVEQSRSAISRFLENPMHRSGLALAGAQNTVTAWRRGEFPSRDNDGILTADEVGMLDLEGTWLVTLSACDTGAGEARNGEGVMGLRRGFMAAGAQNLLMTLWPISDKVTVQVMIDFYAEAYQHKNAALALAKVQRDWLSRLRREQGLARAVSLAGPFLISSQGKL
ncbi:MAG: CHAT domain-containing protein, partial [Verrucomicrobia bacterium]|nr:CHAT domain-containing protein [Verrucomicrobiota bacterium]